MQNTMQSDSRGKSALLDRHEVRVLLIEDDKVDCKALQRHLEAHSETTFYVMAVSRLEQAFLQLRIAFFDVIVLDLNLPDSRGGETISKMHSQSPQAPLIIWTGNPDAQLSEMATAIGVQAYLIKGVTSMQRLVWEIYEAVRERRFSMAGKWARSRSQKD
jgi:DNA-binding NtrC family response regulator